MTNTLPQGPAGQTELGALERLLGGALEQAEHTAAGVAEALQVVKARGGQLDHITGPDFAVRIAALRAEIGQVLADDQADLEAALRRVDNELRVIGALLGIEHDDQGAGGGR